MTADLDALVSAFAMYDEQPGTPTKAWDAAVALIACLRERVAAQEALLNVVIDQATTAEMDAAHAHESLAASRALQREVAGRLREWAAVWGGPGLRALAARLDPEGEGAT